jgi:Fic family protein
MKPPYELTKTILLLYGQIMKSLGNCQSLLLVKPEARLRKQNRIKTIQSSLAIEGNTLDLEHVTALLEKKRVLGPEKDILEVKNAIEAYSCLPDFKAHSVKDFLKAHKLLMNGLVDSAGRLRNKQVGVIKGKKLQHVAPKHTLIPGLIDDLFKYLKKNDDPEIIKSCVFHYEIEFIHPFQDGNGRMGRLWQTRLLMETNPIFEFIPVEEAIRNNQEQYYKVLGESDKAGDSTAFIEFMLDTINISLQSTVSEVTGVGSDLKKRSEYALSQLKGWFDRKDYMKLNKGISTATASRDLKQLLENGQIESSGKGRMTKYIKKESYKL